MFGLLKTNRFGERLRVPADAGEVQRTGRALAVARTLLGGCSLVAIYVDPTEPGRFGTLVHVLLFVYIAFSVAVLAAWLRGRGTQRLSRWVHATDIAWAAFVCLFSGGPNSPFFMFFLFVLLAAGYRWGLRETLLTAGAIVGVVLLQALVLVSSWGAELIEGEFELNRFIMRTTYLFVLGFFLGYLAEEEKQLKAESSFSIRVIAKARAEAGLGRAVRAVFEEVLRLFASDRLLMVTRETKTGRAFLWEAWRTGPSGEVQLQWRELEAEREPLYLFDTAAQTWYARRRGSLFQFNAFDAADRRLRDCPAGFLEPLAHAHNFDAALMVSFLFGQEWSGRVFVLAPAVSPSPASELRFLQALLRQLGPALYNIYLVRRLRARAGALERARVARELHDGSIQSLAAMEMQMDVLRRRIAAAVPAPVTGELERIQRLLREEVLNLRELMEQLKPIELTDEQLVAFLADSVQKFGRETGIVAEFVPETGPTRLPPRCCGELARIVQEALINVRKHSQARKVVVRLAAADGLCRLSVADDGKGFDFAGSLSHEELEAAHKGPSVIKERVRALGGRLTVESTPGSGARLNVLIPVKHA